MHKLSARIGGLCPDWIWTRLRKLHNLLNNQRNFARLAASSLQVCRYCDTRLRRVAAATIKNFGWYAADLALSSLSLIAVTVFRLGFDEANAATPQYEAMFLAVPLFVAICAVVFPLTGLYSRNWRYTSIPDLVPILKAVALSSLIFISCMFLYTRLEFIPRSVIAIQILLLTLLLTGIRLSFRLGEVRTFGWERSRSTSDSSKLVPVLLVGGGNAVDHFLRALQRDNQRSYWPVGVLDKSNDQQDLLIRGVPVLGGLDDFEVIMRRLEVANQRPRHLIFTESLSKFGNSAVNTIIERAEKRGLAISRLPSPTELRNPRTESRYELRPIELTDLLERPQTALDRDALLRLVRGRRVLVTGAGGSIGGELVQQIAALAPAELVMADNCEYNLYAIDLELSEKFPQVPRLTYLCDVRDARRVNEIFDRHRPELVFHAAALKHVPMVELNPCEGVLTNVIGTMHVAEATRRIEALGMVQISSDKVVNSTSVMGMTKRLAELYCQALDLEFGKRQYALHDGAVRKRARLQRLAHPALQAADRQGRTSHGHPF